MCVLDYTDWYCLQLVMNPQNAPGKITTQLFTESYRFVNRCGGNALPYKQHSKKCCLGTVVRYLDTRLTAMGHNREQDVWQSNKRMCIQKITNDERRRIIRT